jgi:hypothetical protein
MSKKVLSVILGVALVSASVGLALSRRSNGVPKRYFYIADGVMPSERIEEARSMLPFERIQLERTGCFGTCPIYSVVFHRSGLAEYSGSSGVERLGNWVGSIPVSEFGRLSYLIEHERVLRLKGRSFSTSEDDAPTVSLQIWPVGSRTPFVLRDTGEVAPIGVWAVYVAIDALAADVHWRRAGAAR